MYSVLLTVVIILSLVTHASKSALVALSKDEDGQICYSAHFLGLMIEYVKLVYSFVLLKYKERKHKAIRYSFTVKDILYIGIPALFSSISDYLYYYLVEVLQDELTVQAFSSLEIVVIGIASYLIIGRNLTGIHWSAILLLCSAITSIQIDSCVTCSYSDLPILPSILALLCAGCEGLQGVFKEEILKKYHRADIAQINTCWGMIANLLFLLFKGFRTFQQEITTTHFNVYTYLLVISDSIRGISGCYILRYADSIVEAFVHCLSLVLASLLVSIIFSRQLSFPYIIAILNLCIATILYESAPETEVKEKYKQSYTGPTVPDSIEMESDHEKM